MADLDDIRDGKNFGIGTPQHNHAFFLKAAVSWTGACSRGWRGFSILNPVVRSCWHLTTAIFRARLPALNALTSTIAPLFAAHRRTDVYPWRAAQRGACRGQQTGGMRASGGNSILTELSNETVAVAIEDALRLNVAAMAAQVYIGSEYEHQSIKNIIQLVDQGMRYGMPTMAVTGVGNDMARDQRYFSLATRIAAEMGAQHHQNLFR